MLSERKSRLVLLLWLIAIAIAFPFSIRRSDHLSLGGYAVPGSQSAEVNRILNSAYQQTSRRSLAVLLWPTKGTRVYAVTQAIHRVETALHETPGVKLPRQTREQAQFSAGLVEPILMPLDVTVSESQSRAVVLRLRHLLDLSSTRGRVEIHLLGENALAASLEEASQKGVARAEVIGFPILLAVLVAIFGSMSAAALPLILAAVVVIIVSALIYALSLATQLSTFTVETASMFGIGVAVDYCLIIVSRVRQEVRAGHDLSTARAIALATSGRAVVLAGLIVIAALAGTWLIPINILRSMAAGAILVVAVAVLASTTLLPVLINIFGRRWSRTSVSQPDLEDIHKVESRWDWWARIVTGHPVVTLVIIACLLVPLSIPMLSMRTGMGTREQLSARSETAKGLREAEMLEGPGALGPIYVTTHAAEGTAVASLQKLTSEFRRRVATLPGVQKVGPVDLSAKLTYALFSVIPNTDPESAGAEQLVQHLRVVAAASFPTRSVTTAVGGVSASLRDDNEKINDGLWKMAVAVLAICFVVLVVTLRSLLLPVKAILMNIISVSVAYGVLVIVFQWGVFDGLLGYRAPGRIFAFVPPLVLAVVFGLSMDYEIFLLSRIRERWEVCGDSRTAVTQGLAASATAISGAAIILVCVFAVFVGTGVQTVKELGLGAAVAIGVDATIVRLALVPATMRLLGTWNWWLPSFLERLLGVHRRTSVREASAAQSR